MQAISRPLRMSSGAGFNTTTICPLLLFLTGLRIWEFGRNPPLLNSWPLPWAKWNSLWARFSLHTVSLTPLYCINWIAWIYMHTGAPIKPQVDRWVMSFLYKALLTPIPATPIYTCDKFIQCYFLLLLWCLFLLFIWALGLSNRKSDLRSIKWSRKWREKGVVSLRFCSIELCME